MYFIKNILIAFLMFFAISIYANDETKIAVSPQQEGCIKGNCEDGTGIFIYPNGDIYKGEWLDNMRHGEGTITYEGSAARRGDIYDGTWKENMRHGKGIYSWSNGDVYEGQWKSDRMDGKGKLYRSSGEWYDGEWRANLKHGKGTYKHNKTTEWEDHLYVGGWKSDKPCCSGEYRYLDGSVFSKDKKSSGVGCKMGNCKNGYGEYQYSRGRRFEGSWRNGLFDGEGTFFYETGEKYVGSWIANQRDGEGQFFSVEGKLTYDGNWKEDVQSGYGIYHYPNGTRYAGQWEKGVRGGKGRFTIPNVGYYEGEFKKDRFNGQGSFYYADRSRYDGEWKDNVKHGKGKVYDPDGKLYREGTWANGDFVE